MTEKSNIERVLERTANETVTAWRRQGAIASNRAQGIRRSVNRKLEQALRTEDAQALVKSILFGELTPDEREYVRSIVPQSIPDEGITPLVAMIYSGISKTIKSGDMSQLERLLRVSGETAELRIKLDNSMAFDQMPLEELSDAELRRLAGGELEIIEADYEELEE